MYAIFIDNGYVRGYKRLDYEGEELTFQLSYRLYEELPEALVGVPANHIVKFDEEAEAFTLEAVPAAPPEPPTTEERFAALEAENINLMLALTQVYEEKEAEKAIAEQTSVDTMLALTELYEMIIGGGA
jgi:hypothetical protein